MIDERDRKLLDLLQYDSDVPLSILAERLNLSPSACSRRITRLRDDGYIKQNSAVVDRERLNIGTTVFVMVKTSQHTSDWLERFRWGISDIPEIVEVHRLAGNLDYIVKIVVTDIAHYDSIYKLLVSSIDLFDVSAYISMETVKYSSALPTSHAT
jgi:Lrp/AsnC family transcriptional regulator